jgi:quercetin dioxygenase-like cupin family protein
VDGGDSGGDRFAEAGLEPSTWDAPPGALFAEHAHPQAKLLTCRAGSIRFVMHPSGEILELAEGDWLELPAGQRHSAVAGPAGVRCAEAFHD